MKAIDQPFGLIINGNKQFLIPVFQRDYLWERPQCLQLWNDILRAGADGDAEHFLGSFVTIQESGATAFSRWMVIDGQQRLTSLTLLLTALRDHIRETNWSGEEPTPEQIDAYFLKNELERGDRRYKLALRRHDNETLQLLVEGKDSSEAATQSKLVVDAYRYFRELLTSPAADPEVVYKGIAGLRIVDVTLHRSIDNPQLVFESLNSTGIDLSQSDLVRNYLLMGLPEAEQTRLYGDYWRKLEEGFRSAGAVPDSFLRDYIALKQGSSTQARSDSIYEEFKSFWAEENTKSVDLRLADMVRFAGFYVSFLRPSTIRQQQLVAPMTNLRRGGFGDSHALLVMRLYDCYDRNLLVETDFIKALVLIKSYLIRRAVLGLQTRAYWGVFARMAFAIRDESPFESFQVALARRAHNYRFPGDGEFMEKIQTCDLYGLRICGHVLERLENAGQRELSPTADCSIEHIMPQSVEDVEEWKQMLGKHVWKTVHETWLHRLGNLTLTAYNSPMSNNAFETKKTTKGGFNDSPVRLNKYVREQSRWTAAEMKERGRMLAERALEIWPHHGADAGLVRDEEVRQLQARAAQATMESLEMSDGVRGLARQLQDAIREVGNVIEVIEHKSVGYYDDEAHFFAELLPMSYYVRVLLPLDPDEVDDSEGLVGNVRDWKFLPNVTHRDCGVFIDVREKQQVQAAMVMVRQAFNVTED